MMYCFFQGAILVYDVASRESFNKIEDWLTELETYSTNHDLIKMLVGGKFHLLLIFSLVFDWSVVVT